MGRPGIKGQVKYSFDKCKVMHMRKTALTTSVGSKVAAAAAQGRALGVNVGTPLEMSAQCSAADKKANLGMLGMIRRGAEEKSEEIILVLCQSMLNNPSPPALGAEHRDRGTGTLRSSKDSDQPGEEDIFLFFRENVELSNLL